MSVPSHNPQNNGTNAPMTTVYTDGACVNNGRKNAKAGSGAWYGENDPCNLSVRVAHKEQSNQTGELVVVLMVVKNHPPNEDLHIISDSKYVIDGITKHAKKWEERGWIDVQHKDLFKCVIAWMRSRKGRTTMEWVKGHNGTRGNKEADRLAGEGAEKQLPESPLDLKYPPNQLSPGAKLARLEQRDFYQILSEKKPIPMRKRTERNIGIIQACTQETFEKSPTTEDVWIATKHKDLTRKTRDFLWKSTQNAYKIGEFWNQIEGYEQRGVCPICDEQEDMEHILTKCDAGPRAQAWQMAGNLWKKRSNDPIPTRLGDILGCGLAEFKKEGKPDRGKNRLYRILVSETAYLIWKMRNERRIRDNNTQGNAPSETETRRRWTHAINRQLTIDRALTDNTRFGKRALDPKVVRDTWKGCLEDEEYLPSEWYKLKGVLVGISPTCSPRRVDRRGTRRVEERSPTQSREAASA